MNGATRPIRASASVRAKPIHMYSVIRPAASGWRAMASIAGPKTRPRPMPGPMAARPYPSAPRRWMSRVWVAARTVVASIIAFPLRSVRRLAQRRAVELDSGMGNRRLGLVPVLQRVCDVGGDQRGEDERLQQPDQK